MRRSGEGQRAGGRRAALFLDVENLVHEYRERGDWAGAAVALGRVVARARETGTLVAAIASCDLEMARRLALPLRSLGVRTFVHGGGPDAADRDLLRRIESELPASCNVLVIGSGDHIFAEAAERLRRAGKRVEVVSADGRVSVRLAASADACTRLRRAG